MTTRTITKNIATLAAAAVLASGAAVAGELAFTEPTQQAQAAVSQGLPTIKSSSSGQAVTALQTLLSSRKYGVDVDGKFGPKTEKAVKEFQKDKGLDVDGVVGAKTWEQLTPTLREGSEGGTVNGLQRLVGADADGKFGADTAKKVKEFQKSKGLDADGVVGPDTWRALITGKSGGGGNDGGDDSQDRDGKKYVNPETVGGYKNGRLPDDVLCSLSFSPGDKVACHVVDEYEDLNAAYRKEFGTDISITNPGGGNAYRTYERQVELYDRYGAGRAAKPGTSNHGWGLAIDIADVGDYGTKKYNWLNENAPKYGFDDTVDGEHWHWEWVGK